jgi:beta-lactam-binding protein with PASTA domain
MLHIFRGIVAGLTLAVIALVAALATMHFAIHGAEVRVPDLSGLTMAQAIDKTRALGLQFHVDDRFYNTTTPAGHVLLQRPKAGTLVRRSWQVRVTESLGPQNVEIPNVLGMDARLAMITIRRGGLQLGDVTSLPFATAAPGTVIAQSPTEHATSIDRPRVDLLLAAPLLPATQSYAMPDFVGESLVVATRTIAQAGFTLAPVAETMMPIAPSQPGAVLSPPPVPTDPSGIVVEQNPEASSRIELGATIHLIVQH